MAIDPVTMVALITSVSSMLISVLTHVRYSKCFNCEVETREVGSSIQEEPRSRSGSNASKTNNHNRNSPNRSPNGSPRNKRKKMIIETEPLLTKD